MPVAFYVAYVLTCEECQKYLAGGGPEDPRKLVETAMSKGWAFWMSRRIARDDVLAVLLGAIQTDPSLLRVYCPDHLPTTERKASGLHLAVR